MDKKSEQLELKLPEVCCGCLGKPDKIITYVDKHQTNYTTSTLQLPVPICSKCIKKYKIKKLKVFLITLGIILLLATILSLFNGKWENNFLWMGIIGFFLACIMSAMLGKPFFHSSKTRISFDNDEYQKLFENLNKNLIEKI